MTMELHEVTKNVSVSPQILPSDVAELKRLGFRSIICNRPDGESGDHPNFEEIIAEAEKHGIETLYLPVTMGKVSDDDAEAFRKALRTMPAPMMAYCRSGTRSITLWALARASVVPASEILQTTKEAGYDMSGVVRRIINGGKTPTDQADVTHDIVIIGGGAAGIAVASSLLAKHPELDVAIVDPADIHYYQPGWTLVGAGVFSSDQTVRTMASVIPKHAKWIKAAVAAFEPKNNAIVLDGCRVVQYNHLVVCPGLKLDWHKIEGLEETLGKNGVTSNYRYDLAPYTWQLVEQLKAGKAVFTQPPMPIKCAGAPQKAMYMSADHWQHEGVLKDIDVEFYNTGAVLFGVEEYVPALMKYVERYGATLNFEHQLVKVDGPAKKAWFQHADAEGNTLLKEVAFDMLHVVPQQSAPNSVRVSPLVDKDGWVDVNPDTLQHTTFKNIYSLGDVMNAPNSKTAAAARMQAPVVVANLLYDMGIGKNRAAYNGYGSCPLTVERGKVVLAEFGYGGKPLPSFPRWLINSTQPSRLAWLLKERLLPPIYWKGMLKGKEWMAQPEKIPEVRLPE